MGMAIEVDYVVEASKSRVPLPSSACRRFQSFYNNNKLFYGNRDHCTCMRLYKSGGDYVMPQTKATEKQIIHCMSV